MISGHLIDIKMIPAHIAENMYMSFLDQCNLYDELIEFNE